MHSSHSFYSGGVIKFADVSGSVFNASAAIPSSPAAFPDFSILIAFRISVLVEELMSTGSSASSVDIIGCVVGGGLRTINITSTATHTSRTTASTHSDIISNRSDGSSNGIVG
ncbi:unnamed protein product [Trichobilharzia regenti]|nr:unnamed protein product [Trichobilharzia regenti]